jgi:hypothetical protein
MFERMGSLTVLQGEKFNHHAAAKQNIIFITLFDSKVNLYLRKKSHANHTRVTFLRITSLWCQQQ